MSRRVVTGVLYGWSVAGGQWAGRLERRKVGTQGIVTLNWGKYHYAAVAGGRVGPWRLESQDYI